MIMNEYNIKKLTLVEVKLYVPFLKIFLSIEILFVVEGISFKIPDI